MTLRTRRRAACPDPFSRDVCKRLQARHAVCGLALVLCLAGLTGGCRTAIDPIAISDAQTAALVKTALINDPQLGSTTIAVNVTAGVVRLSGTVGTRELAERAVSLTKGVAGVRDVTSDLAVGAARQPGPPAPDSESRSVPEVFEPPDDPRLFAVGLSVGWSGPRAAALQSHMSLGPLLRFGSGDGFGPAFAFDWFQATVPGSGTDTVSRIHVRPIMAGASYTWARERISLSPSLVAGVAFNSMTVPDTGQVSRIAVEADNSFIWRPGVSMWFDLNRQLALNVSAGYAMTGLHITYLEDGRLVKQRVDGDTAILHAGIAYKLF